MARRNRRSNRFPVLVDEGENEPLEWVSAITPSTSAAELLPDSDGETDDAISTSSAVPVTPGQQSRQRKTSNNPSQTEVDTPPPSPPSLSFAPVGRPMVRKRFRNKIPNPLRVGGQRRSASISSTINNRYSVRTTWGDYVLGYDQVMQLLGTCEVAC